MYRMLRELLRLGRVGETPPRTERDPSSASPLVFRHSLGIRHVDAGSCNGCELELNALGGPHYGLEQAGFHFGASPRHADVLTVTGPVTRHMVAALQDCRNAMPEPRRVIAIGDCACGGGVFRGSYAVMGSAAEVLPVDVQIPGCPPNPDALLRGLLQVSGERIDG